MGANLCKGGKSVQEPSPRTPNNNSNNNHNDNNNNSGSAAATTTTAVAAPTVAENNTTTAKQAPQQTQQSPQQQDSSTTGSSFRVLVVFYSLYGHNYEMAKSVAEGVREVEGAEVDIMRIRETLPEDILAKMGATEAQQALAHIPVADPFDFAKYDAVILGVPTRFGLPPAQVQSYLDALGQIWAKNEAVGKVASVWTSTGTQHGGQESTILAMFRPLFHLGMLVVGLPFIPELATVDSVQGGSFYGAGTIAGGDGSRMPSPTELTAAKYQGKHVAAVTRKMKA